jgi:uncharacterized protein involved in exopolysaccharide biosynthesis
MTDRSLIPIETPAPSPPTVPIVLVNPGFTPLQIASMLWAHRKAIITIGAVVFTLSLTVLMLWPRQYTASTTLMVNFEVNDPVNGKDLPANQLGSYIATQVELMQTPDVLREVVDRLDLIHNPEYTRMYSGRGTLRDWVASNVLKNLEITQGKSNSQLIHIDYSGHEPDEAAQIANTIATVYEEQDYARAINPPGERAKIYTSQLGELKSRVDQLQQKVTDFHQTHSLLDDEKFDIDSATLSSLEERLVEAQNTRRAADARVTQDAGSSDQVLSSNYVQTLKAQLAQQEFELADHSDYTEKNPALAHMRAEVAHTRAALAAAVKTYSKNASASLAAAQEVEGKLQRAVDEQRTKVLKLNELRNESAKYQLELDSAKDAYRRALADYDQFRFASAGHYRNVSVVSRAIPPVSASKPKMLVGFALCVMLTGAFAFGLPMGYELVNRRVRHRDDIEREYGITVLAELPGLPVRARS